MAFNPLAHRGIPLDKQLRNWSELNMAPYDKHSVDPYTRCRVIAMNGIEVETIMFSHQFNRKTDIPEVKAKLAELRYVSQQQQKAVNWLIPAEESTIEVTLGFEQLAVDLTAWVARSEPDPYLAQTYRFGVLEDFDHLYRYANLYELLEGKKAEQVISDITEVMPGRPTIQEHRNPVDNIRKHMDKQAADPLSFLHALTITSAEQQTMNFYMTIGNRYLEPIARGLYLEIGQIEEQHVTQYESLLDPNETWFESLVRHAYNECYLYWSFMSQEVDSRIKALWELHLNMELEHLHIAGDLLQRYEGRDAAEILPTELPEPVLMEPNKQWLRETIAGEVNLTSFGTGYVRDAHERFQKMQETVNAGGVPSEQIVEMHRDKFGSEYRIETDGPHPVVDLRDKAPERTPGKTSEKSGTSGRTN